MRKTATIALTLATMASIVVANAVAAPPTKETFFSSFSFEDTWTCPGTTIVQSNEERDTIVEFSPTRLRIQRHGVATLAANGKTLTSNFSAMIFEDWSVSQVKVVGTVYNIQVPGGGSLLLDAGKVVIDLFTDPPTFRIAGPHQQFLGDVSALCAYLAAA
ncbi:MAG TPA: hypothetical protein VFR38_07865 [Gaiellaceae bacterium]|nr:hypothetical protein [Gaiellaceae bacterium]